MRETDLAGFDPAIKLPLKQYLDAYDFGIKNVRNTALANFISAVKSLAPEAREVTLEHLCPLVFEKPGSFPVQFPLMRELLVPYLLENFHARRLPHVRWLAQCAAQSEMIKEATGGLEKKQLLQLALEIEPQDSASWQLLAQEHFEILDFATHHLPEALVIREEVCRRELSSLAQIFMQDSETRARYQTRYDYLHEVLDDWERFQAEVDVGSFAAWCIAQKRNYHWMPSAEDSQD